MKTLKELNLLSKFLFDQTMDMPEAHEAALRIIFADQDLRLLNPAQTEKEFRTMPWLRSVRLDVFAMDEERYQGLIDSSLLEPGSADFNALNDTCIIMITPFDLFGKEKYCYTFYPYCKEDREIALKGGFRRTDQQ